MCITDTAIAPAINPRVKSQTGGQTGATLNAHPHFMVGA